MGGSYRELGSILRELRLKRGLTQEKVVEEVATALEPGRYYDARTLRRYESGEIRPPRAALILTLVKALKETNPENLDRILKVADYAALTSEEISRYALSQDLLTDTSNTPMPLPEPQKTRWGPVDGKPEGICINSYLSGEFVPWAQLKPEIEERLLNQLGRHIPLGCIVELDDFRGLSNWLVRIIDPQGKRIGYVWFGTDADNAWGYDGLVRAGDDTYVVWQVFQRYSDGSYHRIRMQTPRAAT